MKHITKTDREKIGNTVIYIAKRTSCLSKTKLLKLLYLMEEYSVKTFNTPFLGLRFEVWQAGPVVKDIFIDLSLTPTILGDYIQKKITEDATYITAIKEFCDDEFSDNDIHVMDSIIERYGNKTAKELVSITHKSDSMWYKIAHANGLLEAFNNKLSTCSDYIIDLSEQLTGKEKEFYQEQLEFMELSRNYTT